MYLSQYNRDNEKILNLARCGTGGVEIEAEMLLHTTASGEEKFQTTGRMHLDL